MDDNNSDAHPNAPAFAAGAGTFKGAGPVGTNPGIDRFSRPGPLGTKRQSVAATPKISGTIVAGGPLSPSTVAAVNEAAAKTPAQWRRYIAYANQVKVGGSLAWRANNPGNLRAASTKIGSVSGAVGTFAVFASMDDGRAAQRNLYLLKYGDMKVRDAINKLTPPSENNTEHYLNQLKAAGVDLDKDVKSQIDALMGAVEANEGMIEGLEVTRLP